MKLWGVFRFEFAYQVRRPWTWLFAAVLLVVCFLVTRDRALADAMYEDFFVNSPFATAMTTVVGGLVWLLLAPVVAGEAAARDESTRLYPLIYTSSISKYEYLGGRFAAALVVNALLLLAVQAGTLLAVYSPGVSSDVIGPFRPAVYLTSWAFISLPTALVATTLQFALSLRSGRAMVSYLGSLFLLFMGFFVASALLFKRGLGTLLDPIGIRFIVEDVAYTWTTVERNTRLIALEGFILHNRLVWIGIAVTVIALTYLRFHFVHRIETGRRWRKAQQRDAYSPTPASINRTTSSPIAVQHAQRTFGFAIQLQKTFAIAWASFRMIAKSWAGLALLAAIPMMTVLVVVDQMAALAVPLVPTTGRVIAELTAPLSAELSRWVIVPLVIVFLAGELVWREREAGISEITDAMPGSEWASLVGKFIGIGAVLVAFLVMQMGAGMVAQLLMGHREFEIALYLTVLLGLQLPEYLLFAMLALTVHVLVNQKYVAHLVAVMSYMFIALLAGMLGVEHNLLVYGAGPWWSYTEMRGFGPFLAPWAWFKLYWAAWALLLAIAARSFWVRGRETGPGVRMQWARRRFTGATAAIAGVAGVCVVAIGGYIFYNTNVLNDYIGAPDIKARRAEYERRYGHFERMPQPQLTGTNVRVDFFPARRAAAIRGSYRMVNGSALPIDSILVATVRDVETRTVAFDRTAALATDDPDHGQRVYVLETALQPGDSLQLDFDVTIEPRGFSNRGVDASMAANGSRITAAWFPSIGYQRSRALISAADRREHGLEPRPVIASLYETEEWKPTIRGGGITFEAIVGTDDDQVAVAPGALRRTWTDDGRRYFHYVTDAPIGNEWALYTARYTVHEAQWNDVAIRIYHHPRHTAHVERMMRAVQASLEYYSTQFGAYPYRHLTVVEHPGAPGTGMHADASMISHGEGVAYWIPKDEPGQLDFPYAVLAHEMAHQWTIPYAFVEGAPVLSEGLAWYAAMQMVRASRGEEQLRQLLTFMRQPYPHRPIRRGEPLLRGLDPYMSYRKGPFAMFAMSEYIGAGNVNGALRRLIARHDSAGAPLATTLDLYRELQAVTPDSLRPMLHDLFEVNTYWQMEAERVAAVETKPGEWEVTLDVHARKVVYDSMGVEREVPMDAWVEIGVFGETGQGRWELSVPIYAQKHRLRSGKQTITVTVTRRPVLAGVDPYHLLDWVEDGDDDNIGVVTMGR